MVCSVIVQKNSLNNDNDTGHGLVSSIRVCKDLEMFWFQIVHISKVESSFNELRGRSLHLFAAWSNAALHLYYLLGTAGQLAERKIQRKNKYGCLPPCIIPMKEAGYGLDWCFF
ncbi:hypothetical protein ATANTOWER_010466 [Ataeniobius toweri]|uniref:Uncharacterized protein n=1 Tax=Ataeniobius toweri TaxID=208326 RepID=A0ABU7A5H3_9TELE|nr:hypothetical protein [Ataeniobius toweri]